MNDRKFIGAEPEILEDLALFCTVAATGISERQRGDALLGIGLILKKLDIDFKNVKIYCRPAGEMKAIYMELDEDEETNPVAIIHSSYKTYTVAGKTIVISSN